MNLDEVDDHALLYDQQEYYYRVMGVRFTVSACFAVCFRGLCTALVTFPVL